jgi:uncharacterized protein (TIGR02266 family)
MRIMTMAASGWGAGQGNDAASERAAGRLEIAMQVRVTELSGANARSYLSRDISVDGLFVRTTRPLAIGTKVQLEFVLPKLRVFKVRGQVARTLAAHEVTSPGDAGMGVRFDEIAKADLTAIQRFLEGHGVR